MALTVALFPLSAHADGFSRPPGGGVSISPGNVGLSSTLTLDPGQVLRGDVTTKPAGATPPAQARSTAAGRPCYPVNAQRHNGGWAIPEPITFTLNADGSTSVTYPKPEGGTAGPFNSSPGTLGTDVGPPGAPQTWGSYLATHTFVNWVMVKPGHYVISPSTNNLAICDQQWTFDTSGPNYLPPTGSWTPAAPCGGNTCTATAFFATSSLTLVTGLGTGKVMSLPSSGFPTYVHTPTCAWLSTQLPEPSGVSKYIDSPQHTVVTSDARGTYSYGVFLEAKITAGGVAWDFGDGSDDGQGLGPGNDPRGRIPQWDPLSGQWSTRGVCGVHHEYARVSTGRTMAASQRFNVTFRAFYNRGGAYGAVTIPCNVNDPDHCAPVISPTHGAPGWSVTHPVLQIESVPYTK